MGLKFMLLELQPLLPVVNELTADSEHYTAKGWALSICIIYLYYLFVSNCFIAIQKLGNLSINNEIEVGQKSKPDWIWLVISQLSGWRLVLEIKDLTRYGLVMLYGNINLGQHWLR